MKWKFNQKIGCLQIAMKTMLHTIHYFPIVFTQIVRKKIPFEFF